MASNELDEHIIHQLVTRGAPIDAWGVGTHLVTGGGDPALTGVYKICARQRRRRLGPDDQGVQQSREGDQPRHQAGLAVHQRRGQPARRPHRPGGRSAGARRARTVSPPHGRLPVLHPRGLRRTSRRCSRLRMKDGQDPRGQPRAAGACRPGRVAELDRLDDTYKRLINPHVYRVSLSTGLQRPEVPADPGKPSARSTRMILSDDTLRKMIADKSIVVEPDRALPDPARLHRPAAGPAFPEDRREHAGEPHAWTASCPT